MHSFWQRVNALATYAGTVLALMCLAVTITDFFHTASSIVSVDYLGVEGLKKQKGVDRAYLAFNMTADLRSEFTWNTKQLFVFVSIEFASPRNPANQMILWNAIIQRRENALIYQPKLKTLYPFVTADQEGSLRGREFNVVIAWQNMPRVGVLRTGNRTFTGFRMPGEYIKYEKGVIQKGSAVGEAGAAAE